MKSAGLTKREKQIVGWMLEGDTNKAIANKLEIHHRSVDVHVCLAYRKLGIKGRPALIKLALDRGVFTLNPDADIEG